MHVNVRANILEIIYDGTVRVVTNKANRSLRNVVSTWQWLKNRVRTVNVIYGAIKHVLKMTFGVCTFISDNDDGFLKNGSKIHFLLPLSTYKDRFLSLAYVTGVQFGRK